MWRIVWEQGRQAVVWIALVLLVMFALGAFIVVVHNRTDADIMLLISDAVDIGLLPKYTGMYTFLGGVVLAVSGAIVLFTAFVLASIRRHGGRVSFLVLLGIAIGWLGIDDIFLFHEWTGYQIARLTGSAHPEYDGMYHEAWVFGAYALIWITLIARYWRLIATTNWLLIGLAMASFGLSIFLDFLHFIWPELMNARSWTPRTFSIAEEFAKLTGYFLLLAYVVQTAAAMIREAVVTGSVSTTDHQPVQAGRSTLPGPGHANRSAHCRMAAR